MSEWWVGRQGSNPVGPVTTDTLIRGILENKVPEDSLVCRVGEQHWQHIAQVDELWEQVHPEQFQTNVTQRPWFAEKGASQPPTPSPVEGEVDDESTRIFSVPILPMRTVDSSPSNPLPARAAFPPAAPAVAPTASVSSTGNAAPEVAPTPAASPGPGYGASPKPVISPPRFGLDRASPVAKVAPVTAQTVPSTIRTDPGVAKAQVALGPALPSAPQPAAALPNRPGIAAPQHVLPVQAPTPLPYKLATEQGHAEPDSVPLIATRPRPAHNQQQNPAIIPQVRPPFPTPQPLPARAPQQPPIHQQPPIPQRPPIPQQQLIQPQPPIHHRQQIERLEETAPSFPDARAPRTTVEPEEDTVTVITHATGSVARANVQALEHPPAPPPPTPPNPPALAPTIREVEPADLFDEDFEPPPSKPVIANLRGADHVSVAPRPAAGTPAPPSVIISHPPPSLTEEVLAHAVASVPEETRPAIRSIRPPGTIQMSIGTLVIGALTLVVLVLLVVLLLH